MKNLLNLTTLVGFIIILIGAAFADSEAIVVPVSVISIGLFITIISLITNKRIKGEQR